MLFKSGFLIFGVFVIFVIISTCKKSKRIKEESAKREQEFFAQNADLFINMYKQNNTGEMAAAGTVNSVGNMNEEQQTEIAIKGDEKIVVLDGYVLNPGDLSWKGFERFGELTVYDRTPDELIEERIKDATIVITNKAVLSRNIIFNAKKLKYIGVIATGYNVVDTAAAAECGIVVTNVPNYGTDAVAQFTFSLILELCNHVYIHSEDVLNNKGWCKAPDFSYNLKSLTDISGKTLGIIGYGNIGKKVAEIARAFGMRILVYSRTRKNDNKVEWVELDYLLAHSDIVSLHCPLTYENRQLICKETIDKMKEGAKLINTARGGLVDEEALVAALNSGKLSGAALDVIVKEPMEEDSPLFDAKNLIVTPHIAWASNEARERLMNIAVNNLKNFLIKNPSNVVS